MDKKFLMLVIAGAAVCAAVVCFSPLTGSLESARQNVTARADDPDGDSSRIPIPLVPVGTISGLETESVLPGRKSAAEAARPGNLVTRVTVAHAGDRGDPVSCALRAGTVEPAPSGAAGVARYRDARIPLSRREDEVREMGRRGDEESIRRLMAIGNEYMYLNRAAIEALGGIRKPEVARYLLARLDDPLMSDATLLCECLRSAAKVLGAGAVDAIDRVLDVAWTRQDGHAERIAAACAGALGMTRSVTAVPVLADELKRVTGQNNPDLVFGTDVIEALRMVGHKDGHDPILAYAGELERLKPDTRLPRCWYEDKIREAKQAAAELAGGPVDIGGVVAVN